MISQYVSQAAGTIIAIVGVSAETLRYTAHDTKKTSKASSSWLVDPLQPLWTNAVLWQL